MNSSKSSYAKIELKLGGSLQELILNKKRIIKKHESSSYSDSYASSILFPFVNRIKDGQYQFQEKNYELDKNAPEEDNALHGLVYNKNFKYIKDGKSTNSCYTTVTYKETKNSKGFPYKYVITLTYVLTKDTLELKVNLENCDTNIFPFNIGWHPYFTSSNLHNSFLKIDHSKKLSFDKNMLLFDKIETILKADYFQIKNSQLDDCFLLDKNTIHLKTPDYSIQLHSSSKTNYLQIYTPANRQQIALEPMTGFANSFNHAKGFQLLNPNNTYTVTWTIKLD